MAESPHLTKRRDEIRRRIQDHPTQGYSGLPARQETPARSDPGSAHSQLGTSGNPGFPLPPNTHYGQQPLHGRIDEPLLSHLGIVRNNPLRPLLAQGVLSRSFQATAPGVPLQHGMPQGNRHQGDAVQSSGTGKIWRMSDRGGSVEGPSLQHDQSSSSPAQTGLQQQGSQGSLPKGAAQLGPGRWPNGFTQDGMVRGSPAQSAPSFHSVSSPLADPVQVTSAVSSPAYRAGDLNSPVRAHRVLNRAPKPRPAQRRQAGGDTTQGQTEEARQGDEGTVEHRPIPRETIYITID